MRGPVNPITVGVKSDTLNVTDKKLDTFFSAFLR